MTLTKKSKRRTKVNMNKNSLAYPFVLKSQKNSKIAYECDEGLEPSETLLAKAEKCIRIAEKFEIDPKDKELIENCAAYLMHCPVKYLDRMLKAMGEDNE